MNPTTDKRLIGFLVNDDFINYILNPNLILKELWEDYSRTHPEDIPILHQAAQILLGDLQQKSLTEEDSNNLKRTIFEKCSLSMY